MTTATPPTATPVKYLNRREVAERLGLAGENSLSRAELPEPDALVGNHKGWLPETIDEWAKSRPGRGWWGARGE